MQMHLEKYGTELEFKLSDIKTREAKYKIQHRLVEMDCYTPELYEELKKLAVYLRVTKKWKQRMVIEPGSPIQLSMQSDSDFAGCPYSSKTTVGAFIWANDFLLCGESNFIEPILTSSAEGEIEGLFCNSKTAKFCFKFVSIFTTPVLPMRGESDNTTAVQNAKYRSVSKRNKHWDVK